ncbi:hypothetical protein SVA_0250 [Sulfurifustis variabilis]|uniref:Uncharacterized protein n=1 Tax=Sulfurifustis variabilis TaxID=1675686 RepID=A0A1B4V2Y4_9GAMM|nr:hypothetical protein SVA_0250 [Sulfurifustis variabilis]
MRRLATSQREAARGGGFRAIRGGLSLATFFGRAKKVARRAGAEPRGLHVAKRLESFKTLTPSLSRKRERE